LNYASLAKRINNTATVNEDPKTRLIRLLRKQIKFLKEQLARASQVLILNDQAAAAGKHAPSCMVSISVSVNITDDFIYWSVSSFDLRKNLCDCDA
jgi:hypothetical protein